MSRRWWKSEKLQNWKRFTHHGCLWSWWGCQVKYTKNGVEQGKGAPDTPPQRVRPRQQPKRAWSQCACNHHYKKIAGTTLLKKKDEGFILVHHFRDSGPWPGQCISFIALEGLSEGNVKEWMVDQGTHLQTRKQKRMKRGWSPTISFRVEKLHHQRFPLITLAIMGPRFQCTGLWEMFIWILSGRFFHRGLDKNLCLLKPWFRPNEWALPEIMLFRIRTQWVLYHTVWYPSVLHKMHIRKLIQ